MLVISRARGEKIILTINGERVVITVNGIVSGKARLGFIAPQSVKILRSELEERDEEFRQQEGERE